MRDPDEGVTAAGMIATGARRERVPATFEPVLQAAVAELDANDSHASLYVYGSVATGTALPPDSDVDLLTVGLGLSEARQLDRTLSAKFSDRCRAVEIAPAQPGDFVGEHDEAYGNRVFLRHYCVHVSGPDVRSGLPEFPADVRAARGFKGDIAQHAARWRVEVADSCDPGMLYRRVSRKVLLAVAGLVSVHDGTWTTDREVAAARWAQIEPTLADDLELLLEWSRGDRASDRHTIEAALDGVVDRIVAAFRAAIGLWNTGGVQ